MARSVVRHYADLCLESDVELPELLACTGVCRGRASWRVCRSAVPYPGAEARWLHEWREPDGRLWLRIGRADGRYVLRFAHWAAFAVDLDARTIECHTEGDTPAETVRHLLLNQVMPLVWAGHDRVALHAAALQHRGQVVAFVGDSGAGKSTLCAGLTALGATLVSDDALLLTRADGRFVAVPTYPGIRLWPDSLVGLGDIGGQAPLAPVAHYTPKRRLDTGAFAGDTCPLARLCVLERGEAVSAPCVRLMAAREAILAVASRQLQLDITNREHLASSFATLADLVREVPVLHVAYPWGLGDIRQSASRVIAAVLGA
jgi:hypothetical protein